MSGEEPGYKPRVTGPAERRLNRLPEGTAAAIVEFMLGALFKNPHLPGGAVSRELRGCALLDGASTASSARSLTPSDS